MRPSHSLIDLSKDADAIILVSGENFTSFTNCWWPVIRAKNKSKIILKSSFERIYIKIKTILPIGFFSFSGFHKKSVKSSDPETRYSSPVLHTASYLLRAACSIDISKNKCYQNINQLEHET